MKMRELEERTGVGRKMIQYYLRNNMLPQPERPKPNVAIYGEQHVNAINSIRRLQTEDRMRIDEIKQLLNGDRGNIAARAETIVNLEKLFAAHAGISSELVNIESLVSRNEKALSDAKILAEVGAITLISRKGKTLLSHIDAEIVASWGDIRKCGLTEEEGFDPSIAALHVEIAKTLATAEVQAFLERVSPDYSTERKAKMAEAGSKTTLGLFTLLRVKATAEAFRLIENAD
ncbi:MerR family transcriptional regulator [Spongiibacter taiwanensis]|uniref:MerR family transcriptional regulator n=1 Tax=Spongiibacter taiwanensis TaxID=1748242 RepID=UPI00203549B4|nr:MerR family transcriptional regulator [Spongiibacter taiwanensis]USA42574.1 MerR family transcriptional regulator [Spongiibacter taiwanensis]